MGGFHEDISELMKILKMNFFPTHLINMVINPSHVFKNQNFCSFSETFNLPAAILTS